MEADFGRPTRMPYKSTTSRYHWAYLCYRTQMAEKREGDHIRYYSDPQKMKAHYPPWDAPVGLEETVRQIVVDAWRSRSQAGAIE